MILNSQYSNFLVTLPPDFFPERLVEKYTKFLKVSPLPFRDFQSYINWTIQSISWAEIQPVRAEQGDRYDIKPFKENSDKTIFLFKETEKLINDLTTVLKQ